MDKLVGVNEPGANDVLWICAAIDDFVFGAYSATRLSEMLINRFKAKDSSHAKAIEKLESSNERMRSALEKINLGRHGELNEVQMALIAFGALQNPVGGGQ